MPGLIRLTDEKYPILMCDMLTLSPRPVSRILFTNEAGYDVMSRRLHALQVDS